ncbi:hypothetical protein J6590_015895 [Homalodisca vitripennis]|nr:hypothetical protein J6590_015895 [Homalodisca vitripennis]
MSGCKIKLNMCLSVSRMSNLLLDIHICHGRHTENPFLILGRVTSELGIHGVVFLCSLVCQDKLVVERCEDICDELRTK